MKNFLVWVGGTLIVSMLILIATFYIPQKLNNEEYILFANKSKLTMEERKILNSSYDELNTQQKIDILSFEDKNLNWKERKNFERLKYEKESFETDIPYETIVREEKAKKKLESKRNEYKSDFSYERLERTPEDYEGKKIRCQGYVYQILEYENITEAIIAIDNDEDLIIYCEIPKKLTSNNRILEDDSVILYATFKGLYTYETVDDEQLTVPLVIVDDFEIQINDY